MNLSKKKLKIGRRVAVIACINVKLHQSKVKIEVAVVNLAEIGLDGICARLRDIVEELDDIENTLDLQLQNLQARTKNDGSNVKV